MHMSPATNEPLNRLGKIIGVQFLSERIDSATVFPFSTSAWRNGEQVILVQYTTGTGTTTWLSTVGSTTDEAEKRMLNLVVKAITEAFTAKETMTKPVASTAEELSMKLLIGNDTVEWKRNER